MLVVLYFVLLKVNRYAYGLGVNVLIYRIQFKVFYNNCAINVGI